MTNLVSGVRTRCLVLFPVVPDLPRAVGYDCHFHKVSTTEPKRPPKRSRKATRADTAPAKTTTTQRRSVAQGRSPKRARHTAHRPGVTARASCPSQPGAAPSPGMVFPVPPGDLWDSSDGEDTAELQALFKATTIPPSGDRGEPTSRSRLADDKARQRAIFQPLVASGGPKLLTPVARTSAGVRVPHRPQLPTQRSVSPKVGSGLQLQQQPRAESRLPAQLAGETSVVRPPPVGLVTRSQPASDIHVSPAVRHAWGDRDMPYHRTQPQAGPAPPARGAVSLASLAPSPGNNRPAWPWFARRAGIAPRTLFTSGEQHIPTRRTALFTLASGPSAAPSRVAADVSPQTGGEPRGVHGSFVPNALRRVQLGHATRLTLLR